MLNDAKYKNNRVFTNPIKILDIKSGGNIKIKLVCNTGEFKKDEIWTVNYKLGMGRNSE